MSLRVQAYAQRARCHAERRYRRFRHAALLRRALILARYRWFTLYSPCARQGEACRCAIDKRRELARVAIHARRRAIQRAWCHSAIPLALICSAYETRAAVIMMISAHGSAEAAPLRQKMRAGARHGATRAAERASCRARSRVARERRLRLFCRAAK